MRITELVESLDLPQTQVAEGAWEDARRRVRRRRGALAAGAAGVAVASVVAVTAVTPPGRIDNPVDGPSLAPSPSATDDSDAPVVQQLLTGARWRAELADLDYGRYAGNLDEAVPLSQDPVGRAALAMGDPGDEAGAFVLGEDGTWRRVDVAGLVPVQDEAGYTSPIVRPTSLSPDATKLALPQPNALVVVNLGDGTSRRYDVPGPANTYAIWADETHVLVAKEQESHGTMVDLTDGSTTPSTYGPSTRFLGDTTLTWTRHRDLALDSYLQWGDGRRVRTSADNGAGFFPQPPLVKDNIVIGVGGAYHDEGELPASTAGITAVDGSTGRILAYLPLQDQGAGRALLFGWDGDRPIIGVPLPQEMDGLFVFAWDWRAGQLDPIGHVGTWTSWGTGIVP
jgi:hypothetical protein